MENMSKSDRKPPRKTNTNDENRTHDVWGAAADADIPNEEVPGRNYLGEKDDTPQHKPRLRKLREGHGHGVDHDMSTLSEEIVALSISSSGYDSDPMTESSGIDAVSLTESSIESEAKTPPSSVHEKEQEPVWGHRQS